MMLLYFISVYLLHWVNSILTFCKRSKEGFPKILFVATHKDMLPWKLKVNASQYPIYVLYNNDSRYNENVCQGKTIKIWGDKEAFPQYQMAGIESNLTSIIQINLKGFLLRKFSVIFMFVIGVCSIFVFDFGQDVYIFFPFIRNDFRLSTS